MIIKSGWVKQGLVQAVEVRVQRRDLVKLFCTVVAAKSFARPFSRFVDGLLLGSKDEKPSSRIDHGE